MNVLAIDTCFAATAVAVRTRNGDTVVRAAADLPRGGQAEVVFPLVVEAMAAAGLAYPELDRIAVTRGPGGFTGVRVGLAAARGLALALGRPVVALSSLELLAATLAQEAATGTEIAVAMEAGRGGVFIARYRVEMAGVSDVTEVAETMAPRAFETADAWRVLSVPLPDLLAGSAGEALVRLASAAGETIAVTAAPERSADVSVLARLAVARPPTPPPIAPLYLRAPDVRPQPIGSTCTATGGKAAGR